MGGRGPGGELYPSLSLKRKVVLAAAKAAVFRINHNVDGCGDLAPPAHRSLRAQLLLANLLAHNLPFPCSLWWSDSFAQAAASGIRALQHMSSDVPLCLPAHSFFGAPDCRVFIRGSPSTHLPRVSCFLPSEPRVWSGRSRAGDPVWSRCCLGKCHGS